MANHQSIFGPNMQPLEAAFRFAGGHYRRQRQALGGAETLWPPPAWRLIIPCWRQYRCGVPHLQRLTRARLLQMRRAAVELLHLLQLPRELIRPLLRRQHQCRRVPRGVGPLGEWRCIPMDHLVWLWTTSCTGRQVPAGRRRWLCSPFHNFRPSPRASLHPPSTLSSAAQGSTLGAQVCCDEAIINVINGS